jgi:hypothetical protein
MTLEYKFTKEFLIYKSKAGASMIRLDAIKSAMQEGNDFHFRTGDGGERDCYHTFKCRDEAQAQKIFFDVALHDATRIRWETLEIADDEEKQPSHS